MRSIDLLQCLPRLRKTRANIGAAHKWIVLCCGESRIPTLQLIAECAQTAPHFTRVRCKNVGPHLL